MSFYRFYSREIILTIGLIIASTLVAICLYYAPEIANCDGLSDLLDLINEKMPGVRCPRCAEKGIEQ